MPGRLEHHGRERLLYHVDAIYRCVADSSGWDAMLADLIDDLNLHNAIMSAISVPRAMMLSQTWVGVPPDYVRMIHSDAAEIVAIWGGETRLLSLPQREPVLQSNVSNEGAWLNMAWSVDRAQPQGLSDPVTIARMRGIVANLAFGRPISEGPITDFETDVLRLLAPHFARAFDITNILDTTRARSATFWEALKVIAPGVVLVDQGGRAVQTNAAAQEMIAAGDPLFERGGRLQLRGEPGESRVFDSVLAAAVNREVKNTGIVGVPGRRLDGRRCVAHVMPLRGVPDAATDDASAAVFVAESDQARPPWESLALLFNLTPAELRIMELITEGKTRAAVARELSIAPATVKVHLRSIFRKTSTTRQPELVRLVRALAPPR